jgi:cytochrome c-type biogenesis protein
LLTEILSLLTDAVSSSPVVAILAAFAWGVLSVILSPCHLASIPLIVGFIGGQAGLSVRRAFLLALLFAGGILATIAAIGMVTGMLGRMLGDLGSYINYPIAAIFFVIGLHFMGVIPMPFSGRAPGKNARRGLLAALILGLIFGLALGPCTFAFMAPMLGVTLRVAQTRISYGIALLLAYGIGHTAVIVAAGTFSEAVERYLRWTSGSRAITLLRRICGVLVILGGIYILWVA